jgi:hypothetical protein
MNERKGIIIRYTLSLSCIQTSKCGGQPLFSSQRFIAKLMDLQDRMYFKSDVGSGLMADAL